MPGDKFALQRPPVEEELLNRLPERHPADHEKAFPEGTHERMDLFGRGIGSQQRPGKHEGKGKAEAGHLPDVLKMLMKALRDSFLPREEISLERQINARTHVGLDFSERLFGKPDDEPEFAARFVVLLDGAREETEHVAVERHAFAWNRDIRVEELLDLRENEDDRADAVLNLGPRPVSRPDRGFL